MKVTTTPESVSLSIKESQDPWYPSGSSNIVQRAFIHGFEKALEALPNKNESKISRSVFQKQVEENKKLLAAIYILTSEKYNFTAEKMNLVAQYRRRFIKDKKFRDILKAVAEQYLEDQPELKIQYPSILK